MTHRTLHAASFTLLTAAIAVLYSSAALAQEPPKPASAEPAKTESQVKAGALFSEARKLVDAGDYKEACPKFEQSLSLNVGIGVQFNLADCWEHTGRTASAHSLFQGVAASARALGQTSRADVAQARADALQPRLVRMSIEVGSSDAGLVVRRNQIRLEAKDLNNAQPIDSGEYLVEASAPGKKAWQARVIVPAMSSEVIAVTVPPLEADNTPGPVVAPVPEKPAKAAPLHTLPPPSPVDPKERRRTAYVVSLASVGVVGVGLGTVFGLVFKSKNDDAKGVCPSSTNCTPNQVDYHSRLVEHAKDFRTGSFVGFGVGAAALVAATVLYFAPSSSSHASGLSAAPFVTADGSWGAFASGKF